MKTMQKAKLIDGVALAAAVQERIRHRVTALRDKGRAVRLDAVRVGGDDAAAIYARPLSAREVAAHFEVGESSLAREGPAALFTFSAGRGDVIRDSSVTIPPSHLKMPRTPGPPAFFSPAGR